MQSTFGIHSEPLGCHRLLTDDYTYNLYKIEAAKSDILRKSFTVSFLVKLLFQGGKNFKKVHCVLKNRVVTHRKSLIGFGFNDKCEILDKQINYFHITSC